MKQEGKEEQRSLSEQHRVFPAQIISRLLVCSPLELCVHCVHGSYSSIWRVTILSSALHTLAMAISETSREFSVALSARMETRHWYLFYFKRFAES